MTKKCQSTPSPSRLKSAQNAPQWPLSRHDSQVTPLQSALHLTTWLDYCRSVSSQTWFWRRVAKVLLMLSWWRLNWRRQLRVCWVVRRTQCQELLCRAVVGKIRGGRYKFTSWTICSLNRDRWLVKVAKIACWSQTPRSKKLLENKWMMRLLSNFRSCKTSWLICKVITAPRLARLIEAHTTKEIDRRRQRKPSCMRVVSSRQRHQSWSSTSWRNKRTARPSYPTLWVKRNLCRESRMCPLTIKMDSSMLLEWKKRPFWRHRIQCMRLRASVAWKDSIAHLPISWKYKVVSHQAASSH